MLTFHAHNHCLQHHQPNEAINADDWNLRANYGLVQYGSCCGAIEVGKIAQQTPLDYRGYFLLLFLMSNLSAKLFDFSRRTKSIIKVP
jgi:hypothetical protein